MSLYKKLAPAALCLLWLAARSVAYVPVFVMLPLDVITNSGQVSDSAKLESQMNQMKNGGVAGVMLDCWFGLVEKTEKSYNFDGYVDVVQLAKNVGLEVEIIMSFHQCGGNVGDACDIPLPQWVLASSDDIFYEDQDGHVDHEYISLFADAAQVVGANKRSPLQVYGDFMAAFKSTFADEIGTTIVEIEVGAGPAGELRYPAYQLDRWEFCGIGAFQSYSSYANASISAAAAAGHPEWAGSPNNAGSYNSAPSDTDFFSSSGFDNYQSDYGKFFLAWYSQELVAHGDAVLASARTAFGSSIKLSLKVAGIHWWYKDASHAAELTSGYWNVPGTSDTYGDIAAMMSAHNATFDFTCLEMQDNEQPSECSCGPYELVQQAHASADSHGAGFAGENALQRYDQTAYDTIKSQAVGASAFTYLRLNDDLMSGTNWETFANFVGDMKNV